MAPTRATIDARHDAFVGDIEVFAQSCGCSFQGNPAYHDRLPEDQAERLKYDYSASGLAERLRCDKRLLNPRTGSHIPVEAKTSFRESGPSLFIFEAYQIGLHRAMRDGCLYAIRKVIGSDFRECGFRIDANFDPDCVREILIPDTLWRNGRAVRRSLHECEDGEEFYRTAFDEWFPGVKVSLANTRYVCRGSGDPYAVLRDSYVESLCDWRDLIRGFADSNEANPASAIRDRRRPRDPARSASRQTMLFR